MSTWNWLDGVLTAIIVVSVVAAALKGFVRELISIATLVAALAIAALGYEGAAVWFEDLTKSHAIALGAGFLLLFLGTLAVGAVVSAVARKLVQTAGLQMFDRVLGGVFGLLRGIAFVCVLLMVMLAFSIKPEVVQQSVLAPYVTAGARVIVLVMPREMKAQFREGFEKFHQALIQHDQTVEGDTGKKN
jgi:membrane protein required for colicin V production